MSAMSDPTRLLATHVHATMTSEEKRYAYDERYNVFLALDLDDADVLFIMGKRAIMHGAEDIEAFSEGYAHAITGVPLGEHPPTDSFIKGYEAGLQGQRTPDDVDESHALPSVVHRA